MYDLHDLSSDQVHLESFRKNISLTLSYWQAPRMETDYLKKCFGNCLAQALAEVAIVRPSDPIEYLAHWLYHYRAIAKAKEENRQEMIQLQEDKDSDLKAADMLEMLERGAQQIPRKSGESHPELVSAAGPSKKALVTQEGSESPEKGALSHGTLPSTFSAIPGEPQQVTSSESAGQVDRNLETP
ncbi:DPY30 domain-containing protein 2 [Ochotona princeps]|uniref:DPY30 domain-containing protein 2 n=1 Tax=Ochotona princeps TaxID=9978 RepID=UPI002714B884|nr:DPY30 domain-containing protein 2 [Ochotona princeps]